jgi:hypothetical protein
MKRAVGLQQEFRTADVASGSVVIEPEVIASPEDLAPTHVKVTFVTWFDVTLTA